MLKTVTNVYHSQLNYYSVACPPAMLRAGIVFAGVCVCLFVCLSAQNLENYWSEVDVAW